MEVIKTIKWPLLLITIISLPPQLNISQETTEMEDVAFNMLRIAFFFWAGWLVVSKNSGGLWLSAVAGALMLLLSHVVIKGGLFLIQGELTALLGVVISYLMFVGGAMVVSTTGGLGARAYHDNNT